MKIKTKSDRTPKELQAIYEEIVAQTDEFCAHSLNKDYASLARQALAAIARKRPSPLLAGKPRAWACGVLYALGTINFLYDKSQTPHMKATELCKGFGLSASTGRSKGKRVMDLLDTHQMDPNWCLPSMMDDNPLIWMVSINGYILDIRKAPRELQEEAYAEGIIPYIPADKEAA